MRSLAPRAAFAVLFWFSLTPVQASQTAEPKPGVLSSAELATMKADLKALSASRTSPTQIKGFLTKHRFDCSDTDGKPTVFSTKARLSCEVYNGDSSDPSPWPELTLGLSRGRLVTALVPEQAAALSSWSCRSLNESKVRMCHTRLATSSDKALWKRDWSKLLKSAD